MQKQTIKLRSPKNINSVTIYSPSFCSKPMFLLIFKQKICFFCLFVIFLIHLKVYPIKIVDLQYIIKHVKFLIIKHSQLIYLTALNHNFIIHSFISIAQNNTTIVAQSAVQK